MYKQWKAFQNEKLVFTQRITFEEKHSVTKERKRKKGND